MGRNCHRSTACSLTGPYSYSSASSLLPVSSSSSFLHGTTHESPGTQILGSQFCLLWQHPTEPTGWGTFSLSPRSPAVPVWSLSSWHSVGLYPSYPGKISPLDLSSLINSSQSVFLFSLKFLLEMSQSSSHENEIWGFRFKSSSQEHLASLTITYLLLWLPWPCSC
jgi:hypothetical protein